ADSPRDPPLASTTTPMASAAAYMNVLILDISDLLLWEYVRRGPTMCGAHSRSARPVGLMAANHPSRGGAKGRKQWLRSAERARTCQPSASARTARGRRHRPAGRARDD